MNEKNGVRPRHWFRRPWFSLLAVIVAASGFLAGQAAGRRAGHPRPDRVVAETTNASDALALALQLERHGADLRVSWDRSAGVIRQARYGRFSIWDGESAPRSFTMDADGLRTGCVVYSPASNSVQFRLEVFGPEGQSAAAWILALIAQPSSASTNQATPIVLVSPSGGAPVAFASPVRTGGLLPGRL